MKNPLKLPYLYLALISGILTGISYPPVPLGFVAWFSMAPLMHVWLHATPRETLKYTFLSALIFNLITVYWIAFNSGTNIFAAFLSMFGAVVYLSLWISGTGYIFSRIRTRFRAPLFMIPFFWVTMEWLRSFGPLGFPWINIALTQTAYLPLIQSADLFGTYGIGFWILVMNIGFYSALKTGGRKLTPVLFLVVLVVTTWLYGESRLKMVEALPATKKLDIAVTQPNINPLEKWEPEKKEYVFNVMYGLLDSALMRSPDLVLWPESALPVNMRVSWRARKEINRRLVAHNGKLLSGTPDYERLDDNSVEYFNATIYIVPDKQVDMYRKIKLVPFGEYIPLSPVFPALKKLNFGQANFISGTGYTRFEVDSVMVSNVICYESSFPELITEFRQRGAELITIQANDGWLGNSSGPFQHFELAKLRAVENRVAVVRAANTGISGSIMPSGRVVYRAGLNELNLFMTSVPVLPVMSIYSSYPRIFPLTLIITLISVTLLSWRRRKV